jgi:hypothetical protein
VSAKAWKARKSAQRRGEQAELSFSPVADVAEAAVGARQQH